MTTDTTSQPLVSPLSGAIPCNRSGRAVVGYDSNPAPQHVWAIMARLALYSGDRCTMHLGDLWHDAQALALHVPIAARDVSVLRWVYGISPTHTHIYWVCDERSEREARNLSAQYDERAYRMRLARDERDCWVLSWAPQH